MSDGQEVASGKLPMPDRTRIVSAGPDVRSVRADTGRILYPPAEWVLVPPGDPALTRRIKAAGPTWSVQEKKGRKVFSRGVWASGAVVEAIRGELAAERATSAYARRRTAGARRRELHQTEYVREFHQAVVNALAFHSRYADLAQRLATAVTEHATPVGSGTVARTQRIPLEQRAVAAVIAWMRHRTTAYDHMAIPRIKGKRREVRRALARRSEALLDAYRAGGEVDAAGCPLQRALKDS